VAATTVRAEKSGRVLTLKLDNPPRNFMTTAMVQELSAIVRGLEGDRSVGSVVITGGLDDIFITHFDVNEISVGSQRVRATISSAQAGGSLRAVGAVERIPRMREALAHTPVAGLVALREIHELFLSMNRLDKTFIAAVNGLALGGGCELALACDVRIMARGDHRIGLPEITLGIIPGAGGTQRLARTVGKHRAMELVLTGRRIGAVEAHQLGLVNRVASEGDWLEQAIELAEVVARRPPLAAKLAKQAVLAAEEMALSPALAHERRLYELTMATEDRLEGMHAFLEKRRPQFKGR
jgi:enoyl-CoA hydratase